MSIADNIEQLKKALEAGGYNAAPSTLRQGAGTYITDLDGNRLEEAKCNCGSKAEKFKQGHKRGCEWWVFHDVAMPYEERLEIVKAMIYQIKEQLNKHTQWLGPPPLT